MTHKIERKGELQKDAEDVADKVKAGAKAEQYSMNLIIHIVI